MIEKFVDKIINNQLKENAILKEDVNIYRYGYVLVFEVLINIIITAIIAFISGSWIQITLFLVIYVPLRSFCGGWHSDKLWKCTIYSNIIIVLMLVSGEYMMKVVTDIVLFVLFIICSLFIFCISPVDTKSKPILEDEREIYKKKINLIILIHLGLFITMMLINIYKIMYVITFSYITQVVMLIIEKLSRKICKIH